MATRISRSINYQNVPFRVKPNLLYAFNSDLSPKWEVPVELEWVEKSISYISGQTGGQSDYSWAMVADDSPRCASMANSQGNIFTAADRFFDEVDDMGDKGELAWCGRTDPNTIDSPYLVAYAGVGSTFWSRGQYLNKTSGSVYPTTQPLIDDVTSPSAYDEILYVGCRNGWIYGFDFNFGPQWSPNHPLPSGVVTTPALGPKGIVVGTNDNQLFAIGYESRDVLWNTVIRDTSGDVINQGISSPPAIDKEGNVAIVTNGNPGYLVYLDSEGNTQFSPQLPSSSTGQSTGWSPIIGPDGSLLVVIDDKLRCYGA